MKKTLHQFSFALALLVPSSLVANPDGAPWGSARPARAENCASCHFDEEVIVNSEAISLSYQRIDAQTGGSVDVIVQFRNPGDKKSGFQIETSAGTFTSSDEDIEVNGRLARSIALRDNIVFPVDDDTTFSLDVVTWHLEWAAPDPADGDVYFWIAINESNDDQSPFGDKIHFKTIRILRPGKFWLLPALR